jgi:polar amino acid transport system permease protein
MDGDMLVVLFKGLALSVFLAVTSLALALVVGLFVALGRMSRPCVVRWPCTIYVECIRGVPLLVLIMWIYFGISGNLVTAIPAAIIAFGICYGAFIGETYRAGIQSVDPGQSEAARALGLSRAQTLRHVVLPQAVRNILPALGNDGIALLKDTSLASVIAIPELMLRGREIASREFNFMKIFTVVALLYLTTTFFLTRVQRLLERRFGGDAHHLRPRHS